MSPSSRRRDRDRRAASQGDGALSEGVLWTRPWFAPLAAGLLVGALYLPSLGYGLVNYDDFWLIRDNELLQQPSLEAVGAILFDLSEPQRMRLGGEYLPLRDLSVMADYVLWGQWYGGHHLTNLVLYGVICALLVLALRRWLGDPALALAAGLLYAAHPLHVEAVAWLSERKGLLAACWLLAALITFHRFARSGRAGMLVATALLMVLSVWSKALTIAGVGALVALLWFFPPRRPTRRTWIGLALVAAAAAVAFVPVWLAGQQVDMVQPGFHGGSWRATAWLMARVHATYLEQLFWSGEYAIRYPLEPGQPGMARGLVGAAVALAILGWAAVGAVRYRPWGEGRAAGGELGRRLSLAAWWWLALVAPVSQLVLPLQNYIADRYMFLPSLAWALSVAAAVMALGHRRARQLILGAMVLLSLGMSWFQLRTWSSTEALFRQVLVLVPDDHEAMLRLAHLARDQGDLEEARRWAERAREVAPDDADVLTLVSLIQIDQGDRPGAIETLRRAVRVTRDDRVRANLALLLLRQGQRREALELARQAARIKPWRAHNQRVLGLAALDSGLYEEAARAFAEALRFEPHNAQNHINLGVALRRLGRDAEAREHLERGRQMQRGP